MENLKHRQTHTHTEKHTPLCVYAVHNDAAFRDVMLRSGSCNAAGHLGHNNKKTLKLLPHINNISHMDNIKYFLFSVLRFLKFVVLK